MNKFDVSKFRKCLPAEMLKERRFVRYFLKAKPDGNGTSKIPLGDHGKSETWDTFENCVAALEPGKEQGIGYCFLGGDVQALDLDHCRNPKTGEICKEAKLLLTRLSSWAEYSVSGSGIHVFFKGTVRGKELREQCIQYWNPKNSPRFFALTCDLVEGFTALKDVGEEFNLVFATARHVSSKIREQLKEVDPEQWAALPVEHEPVETVGREKAKHKTRKVAAGFDIKDFLAFYKLKIDNETDNELGHCIRLTTCPIKGAPHVGHNSTTCNFIYPTTDGGLGFHCQSTGCVEYGVADVVKKLAADKGAYPKPIYEQQSTNARRERGFRILDVDPADREHTVWLWPGYLEANQLVHLAGASGEGKSPVTRDLIAKFSSGQPWPDGSPNNHSRRCVLILSSEDDWKTVITPHLVLAGANFSNIKRFQATVVSGDTVSDVTTALDADVANLEKAIVELGNVGWIIIDPITNYLGRLAMNKEEDMRGILMPLAELAQRHQVCVSTVGHLNKNQQGTLLQRVMGAAAFVGVARQILFFTADPEEDSKFSHVVGFGRNTTTPGLKYKTELTEWSSDGKTSGVVTVAWNGESTADIEEAVNAPAKQSDKSANKQVQILVKMLLKDGAKPTAFVEQAIKETGVVCANWQRAAKGVAKSRQITGKGAHAGWEWYLPTTEQKFVFDVPIAPSAEGIPLQ